MLEAFSRYVKSENICFKHARGISDHSGKEFHIFHEIILFLGGEAELISETIHTKLKPQTLIIIPKETYHQILIKGNQEEYCRCVFQFYETDKNTPLINNAMNGLFIAESDNNTMYLFSKMINLAKGQNTIMFSSISESVLNLLLDEIKDKNSENYINTSDTLTKEIIEYISQRLTDDLKLEDIAHQLNVSTSTLMHTFKKNMNISIHKYIIKKRLILAHNMISAGEQSIIAATKCGFNDYSGFYKQYVKMFNITPSTYKKVSR